MPPLPPLKDVLDALQHCVLPGAGAAALMLGVFLVVGRSGAALGSAVAVAVAYLCGNFTLANLSFDDPLPTWENTSRLLLWKPVESQKPTEASPGYQWLPRAALVLLVVGLVTRWLGLIAARMVPERVWWSVGVGLLVWLPRAAAVYVVSAWLVLGNAASKPEWEGLRWQLAGATLLGWLVLDVLARDGISAQVSAYLAAMFFAGGVVLLYSHNAKFMELAVVMGAAMFGIAVVACAASAGGRLSVSGAIPAAVVFLPGLLLGTRPAHDATKVPALSFWLVALAPLALAPFLVPRVSRQNRFLVFALRAAAVLLPLAVAVILAGQHEKLPYEEEWGSRRDELLRNEEVSRRRRGPSPCGRRCRGRGTRPRS